MIDQRRKEEARQIATDLSTIKEIDAIFDQISCGRFDVASAEGVSVASGRVAPGNGACANFGDIDVTLPKTDGHTRRLPRPPLGSERLGGARSGADGDGDGDAESYWHLGGRKLGRQDGVWKEVTRCDAR